MHFRQPRLQNITTILSLHVGTLVQTLSPGFTSAEYPSALCARIGPVEQNPRLGQAQQYRHGAYPHPGLLQFKSCNHQGLEAYLTCSDCCQIELLVFLNRMKPFQCKTVAMAPAWSQGLRPLAKSPGSQAPAPGMGKAHVRGGRDNELTDIDND